MGYSGQSAAALRAQEGVFLESVRALDRDIDGFRISGDQVFELLFLSGAIRPAHGSLLLQFFGGISPDLEADDIMRLAVPPSVEWIDERVPFQHRRAWSDDDSIASLKEFFRALHIAYRLGVPVLLDV
jgi:hypothetical protein